MSEPIDDRVIWRAELQRHFKVCGETMRKYIKSGKVPPPDIKPSQKRQGWNASTLIAHGISLAGI